MNVRCLPYYLSFFVVLSLHQFIWGSDFKLNMEKRTRHKHQIMELVEERVRVRNHENTVHIKGIAAIGFNLMSPTQKMLSPDLNPYQSVHQSFNAGHSIVIRDCLAQILIFTVDVHCYIGQQLIMVQNILDLHSYQHPWVFLHLNLDNFGLVKRKKSGPIHTPHIFWENIVACLGLSIKLETAGLPTIGYFMSRLVIMLG